MSLNQVTPPSQLNDLQTRFSDAIFSSSKSTDTIHDAAALIKQTQALKPEDRLQIYVDDYWNRCMGSLSDDFSILKGYMGEKPFLSLLEAYLQQFKSTEFTLYYLGRHLPEFIQNSSLATDKDVLVDIAQFEWTQMEVSFAKTKAALDPQTVSDPNLLLTEPLTFQDHVFLYQIQYPTWYDKAATEPIHLILYKEGLFGRELTLEALEFQLFSLMKSGRSISDSVDEICRNDDTLISPEQIQAWFQRAIELKWLIEL